MRYMLFDRWGNPLGDLPYAIKAIRTRATDATDTLDITTIGEINKDERIVFKDSMGRWAEYLCQSTQTARAAGMPVTVAYCTGSIAELSRTYIEDKRNRKANAKACLAKALEGTRWAVGTVETGTITGTARYLKKHLPQVHTVGLEPATSPLITQGKSGAHGLQGIGANFIPKNYDASVVDEVLTVTDEEAYKMAKLLARTEGILVGITSGAALAAAVRLLRMPENAEKTLVALLPDSGDRYFSTPIFE